MSSFRSSNVNILRSIEKLLQLDEHIDYEWRSPKCLRGVLYANASLVQFRIYAIPVEEEQVLVEFQRRSGPILPWLEFVRNCRDRCTGAEGGEESKESTSHVRLPESHYLILDQSTLDSLWSMVQGGDPHLALDAWAHLAMLAVDSKNHERILRTLQTHPHIVCRTLDVECWQWELRLWCLFTLHRVGFKNSCTGVTEALRSLAKRLRPTQLSDRRAMHMVKELLPIAVAA